MHGPWHMPEHPDELDDGGVQEHAAWEAHMFAHLEGEAPDLDVAESTDAPAFGAAEDAPRKSEGGAS